MFLCIYSNVKIYVGAVNPNNEACDSYHFLLWMIRENLVLQNCFSGTKGIAFPIANEASLDIINDLTINIHRAYRCPFLPHLLYLAPGMEPLVFRKLPTCKESQGMLC